MRALILQALPFRSPPFSAVPHMQTEPPSPDSPPKIVGMAFVGLQLRSFSGTCCFFTQEPGGQSLQLRGELSS